MPENLLQQMSYNTPDGKPPDHRQLLIDLISQAHGPEAAMVADTAFKNQDKQIQQAMTEHGMTAEQVLQAKGIDLNNLVNGGQKKQGNFLYTPFQVNDSTGEVTPENILGGLIKSTPADTLRMVEAYSKSKANQGFNTEESVNKLSKLNQALSDAGLGDYQGTQTAEGNFIVHPKPGGVLAQLDPQQLDSITNSLLSGNTAPSQLPRLQKSQIIAATLAKDPSYNPAKADIDFAVNKVGAGNFEKLYNNVTSFEKTFRKNADIALQISDNFDRNKIPLVNKAIMAGKLNITGDPEASKMATALYTVATEYARLTASPGATGSQITDSAREEARSMLNTWQNQGTIRAQLDPEIGIMSIDAKNRVDALNETRDEIKNRYNKGNSSSSNKSTNYKSKYGLE